MSLRKQKKSKHNSFYEVCITLLTKPGKSANKEKYRIVSLMNLHIPLLQKCYQRESSNI